MGDFLEEMNKEEKRKVCQQLGLYRITKVRLYIFLPPRTGFPAKGGKEKYELRDKFYFFN